MFDSKNFLTSKTIQGILAAAIGFAISRGWIPEVSAENLAGDILNIAGLIWAFIGRYVTNGEKLKLT